MNNLGHNNPPKFKTRVELIAQRKLLNKSLINNMSPILNGLGKRSTPMQHSDSEEPGFFVVCGSKEKVSFWLRVAKRKWKLGEQKLNITAAVVTEYRSLARELKTEIKKGNDPKQILTEKWIEAAKQKTFNQVLDEFIKERVNRFKSSTKINFINRTKVWIKFDTANIRIRKIIDNNLFNLNIGVRKISTMDKDVVLKFHEAIPLKYQANRLVEDIRLILKYAKDKKYLTSEIPIFEKDDLNKEYKRIDKQDVWTAEDIAKIRSMVVKNICPWVKNYINEKSNIKKGLVSRLQILLGYYLGRRYKSEVNSLKWNQIDLKNKKNEASWIHLKDTKEGDFSFPINQKAKAIFYLMRRYKDVKGHPLNIPSNDIRSQYVFPTLVKKSKKPYARDFRKTLINLCKSANVEIKVPYMLRHSYWTHQENLTTEEKMTLGGWKSAEMVRTYSKITEKMKISAANKTNFNVNKIRIANK